MAVHNPSALYTGGAERFNSQPEVNMYANLLAKRQAQDKAKNEAFDEYIRGLNTKITPTGVRTVDLDAFNTAKARWEKFGMENKDKILKNDIPTRTEFNRLYQEALNIPIESKAAEEQKKPFVEILTDPKKRSQLSSNVFGVVKSHDEPLYVPDENGNYVRNHGRKTLDYTSKIFNPQFDFNKAFEGWAKDMKMGESVGDVVGRDKITGRATVAYKKAFSPDQTKQMALNAARSAEAGAENNDYYQLRYEKMYESPEETKKLNEAFQSVFGAKIKLPNGQEIDNYIDSPAEVAAAEAILQARAMGEEGTKAASDYDLKQSNRPVHVTVNTGTRPTYSTASDGNAFDGFPNQKFKNFYVSDGSFYDNDGNPKNGNIFITSEIIPAKIKSTLKSGGLDVSSLDEGVNAVVKDGKIVSISNAEIGTVSREDMEGVYQRKFDTEPMKGERLEFNKRNGQPTNTNKKPTYQGLDKNGNQIFK